LRSSNIFHNRCLAHGWYRLFGIVGFALTALPLSARANDASHSISQYVRTSWGTEKGFPGGSVSSIAQTPDGYLWIGTDRGLVRFDGLSFRKFDQATPNSFPVGAVTTLLTDQQGNLWILLRNTKLLRYHDGIFELSRGQAENGITAISRSTTGRVLVSSLAKGTLAYDGKEFQSDSSDPAFADPVAKANGEPPDERATHLSWSTGVTSHLLASPTSAVVAIAPTSEGKIWLGTEDRGLFVLNGGRTAPVGDWLPNARITCLLPLDRSALWVGTNRGMVHWTGSRFTTEGVPTKLQHVGVLSLMRDSDSNLWIGTDRGLFRYNSGQGSLLSYESSPTGMPVSALFEDRERNLWVGGLRTLERLRASAFATYSLPGLRSQSMGALYVDSDNQIWCAPMEGGLWFIKNGKQKQIRLAGLQNDIVYSIAGGRSGEIWVGRQRGGLTVLRYRGNTLTAKTYDRKDGLAQNSIFAVHQGSDGGLWLGTLNSGLSELKDGHFTNYTTSDGLASNTVSSMAEGINGTMWFGTPKGVSEFVGDVWKTYTAADGLPSEDVNCLFRDSAGILWIGTSDGLGFLSAGHAQSIINAPDPVHEPIFGIAEDKNGSLWISSASHIMNLDRSSLLANAVKDSNVRPYGPDDGLRGTEGVKRYQSVFADGQGQVWFSTNHGVSVVNPSRAIVGSVPAILHISAVLADGNPLDLRSSVQISAKQKWINIRFAGLSLANSERVRYRYRLDGFDKNWSDPVSTPEAGYANLGAGSYTFHVIASNSQGLWNSQEANIGFAVLPTLSQTWWFRLLLLLCIGLAILALYRFRVHQLTRLLNLRFEERLAERTRIAQELHDTLLQGVISASMQLDVANDQLSSDSPSKPLVGRVLELMRHVVDDGRNAVRGLRSSKEGLTDLDTAFSRIPEELAVKGTADFRVVVEGPPRTLRPMIRDEVYRIGREAVANAFRHSGAKRIEVDLEYGDNELRISVRDDGKGIDPGVVRSGRDGHWGLLGMRERAENIGARFKVWSSAAGGTEVDLRVPGRIAFESHNPKAASKSAGTKVNFR
jgi:ligand-binding sensor domain-containing protein/signal transduction histidine kinase